MNRTSKFRPAVALILLTSALLVMGEAKPEAPDAAYVQSFEKWKAGETADLKQNWLSFWACLLYTSRCV